MLVSVPCTCVSSYFVPSGNEALRQLVDVVFYPTHVGVEEVRDHARRMTGKIISGKFVIKTAVQPPHHILCFIIDCSSELVRMRAHTATDFFFFCKFAWGIVYCVGFSATTIKGTCT